MIARIVTFFAVVAAALLASGCATRATSIEAQWVSPALAGRDRAQSVLVVAALRDSTHRRMLEDRLVAALSAAGVKAQPSHRFAIDSGQVSEAQLRKAVADSGASYVLMSSISGVTTDVRVTQQMMMGPAWGPGWGWHSGMMGPGWGGMSTFYSSSWNRSLAADVRTTQNVHGDTRMFDAKSAEVVWSAATRTATGWDSVPDMINQYASLIVDALRNDRVI
jgi:hypothetical protein